MKYLLIVRNRIENFCNRFARILGCVLRFAISLAVLLIVRNSMSYNPILSHMWFILVFSVVCAFISIRILPIVLGAYSAVQVSSLSLGVGITVFLVMAVMYLLYFRVDEKYGYAVLIMILLCAAKIPLTVTLALAAVAPVSSITVIICSNVMYYMMHFINLNSAVLTGYADASEITRASVFLNGLFTYKEFIYTLLIMLVVFITVFIARRINTNRARDLAIALGAGLNIILMLLTNVILGSLTYPKLRTILIGSIVSFVIALLIENIFMPIDFSQAEYLEFEDEEYHYFVRALPKINLDKETVHVTKINSRKKNEVQAKTEENKN